MYTLALSTRELSFFSKQTTDPAVIDNLQRLVVESFRKYSKNIPGFRYADVMFLKSYIYTSVTGSTKLTAASLNENDLIKIIQVEA